MSYILELYSLYVAFQAFSAAKTISFQKFLFPLRWYLRVVISKSRSDLDFGPTMRSIELVRDIFIYNNVFKFHVPR